MLDTREASSSANGDSGGLSDTSPLRCGSMLLTGFEVNGTRGAERAEEILTPDQIFIGTCTRLLIRVQKVMPSCASRPYL